MGDRLKRIYSLLGLESREKLLGFTFILAVAIIWVAASFAVQGIESTGVHPAVLTYIANSLFALYLPIYLIHSKITERSNKPFQPFQELQTLFSGPQSHTDGSISHPTGSPSSTLHTQAVPFRQLFKAACIVAPMWYFAQLTFNASLELTSVTSNTILSSASALFTFLFSIAFLSERFTFFKLACIIMLMGGTAMVTLADSTGDGASAASVWGDLLCLLSAVIYGSYTVAIRKSLGGDDDAVPMTLFFGLMGGLIFFIAGPILGLQHLLGADLGTMTWKSFGMVVLKGLLDNVLSDYLWARSILLIGPTIASAGLSLQVPIAIVLDGIFRNPRWLHGVGTALLTLLGGVVVLAGFIGINVGSGDVSNDEVEARRMWEAQAAALQAELEDVDEMEVDGVLRRGGGGGL